MIYISEQGVHCAKAKTAPKHSRYLTVEEIFSDLKPLSSSLNKSNIHMPIIKQHRKYLHALNVL